MIQYESNIKDRVLVSILDELQLVTNPFVGMRVYIKKINASVLITEIENNKVTGFVRVIEDNIDERIDLLYPVKLTYDLGIKEQISIGELLKLDSSNLKYNVPEIVESDSNVAVFISNFTASIDGEYKRIYKLFVNGSEILRGDNGEFIYKTFFITNGEYKFIFKIEVAGFEVFIERILKIVKRTKVIFSSDREVESVFSIVDTTVLPALGGLYYKEVNVYNSSNSNYLWIVSPWPVSFVCTSLDPQFVIEGFIVKNQLGLYYWRSFNKLNSGNWQLTVR